VNSAWIWILGLVPPTDTALRVRELRRAVLESLGLSAGLALPVLIPLQARMGPPGGEPPFHLPPGRLESGRLVASGSTVRVPWLLWTVRAESGASLWPTPSGSAAPAGNLPEEKPEPLFPGQPGFPLAFSPFPETLQAAAAAPDFGPPRAFRPLRITLYRVRSLRPAAVEDGPVEDDKPAGLRAAAAAGAMWESLFRFGLVWEELEAGPLRRRAP
jgi:hypothetical protein